jgi:Bacterial capsule synthesis protein PGA_cap
MRHLGSRYQETPGEAPGEAAGEAASPGHSVETSLGLLRSAKLVFGGDILTHLNVVRTACPPTMECDFARLLAPTRPVVEAADLAIRHLAVPIVRPKEVISGYPTFGAPWKLG